jgi:hypothetical protein
VVLAHDVKCKMIGAEIGGNLQSKCMKNAYECAKETEKYLEGKESVAGVVPVPAHKAHDKPGGGELHFLGAGIACDFRMVNRF